MNPVELGKAIADYGTPIITAVLLVLVVGLVWYFVKRQTRREDKTDEERTKRQDQRDKEQKEERDYYRVLITNDLHKNEELNIQGITLQKEMMNGFKEHNGHNKVFQEKSIEILGLICDRLNGGNSKMKTAKKNLKVARGKN